ncbi:MAG: hypothetical protein ACOH1Q_10235 [Thiobacillus sp.]
MGTNLECLLKAAKPVRAHRQADAKNPSQALITRLDSEADKTASSIGLTCCC